MKKFIQYAFWPNCNNHCDFCIHRGKRFLSQNERNEVISDIRQILASNVNEFKDSFDISFIGGDFFDNQLDSQTLIDNFYALLVECNKYYLDRRINRFMICTSLIYDIDRYLIPIIKFLKKMKIFDRFMICTSFDTVYRFKNEQALELWEKNILRLTNDYHVIVHTEIILTEDFISKVMNNNFSIIDFEKKYNTKIDFIEPTYCSFFKNKQKTIESIPAFFPSRKHFLSFLKYLNDKKLLDLESFLNIKLRSQLVYFQNKDKKWIKVDDRWEKNIRRFDEKGNNVKIYTYSDSQRSMTDDVDILKK